MNETNPQQAVGAPLERQVRPLADRIRRWLDGEVEQTSSALLREAAAEIDRTRWALLQIADGAPGPRQVARAALEA